MSPPFSPYGGSSAEAFSVHLLGLAMHNNEGGMVALLPQPTLTNQQPIARLEKDDPILSPVDKDIQQDIAQGVSTEIGIRVLNCCLSHTSVFPHDKYTILDLHLLPLVTSTIQCLVHSHIQSEEVYHHHPL